MSEADHQMALFQWRDVELAQGRHPNLAFMYHTPNGEKRDKRTGARLKAMGTQAGVPDIHLPVARGRYHGLWIELKSGQGQLSVEQRKWFTFLIRHRHKVRVCHDWEEARDCILDYLTLKDAGWPR